MGRRVRANLPLVPRGADDLSPMDDHGADRHVSGLTGALRLAQCEQHEMLVAAEEVRVAHALSM